VSLWLEYCTVCGSSLAGNVVASWLGVVVAHIGGKCSGSLVGSCGGSLAGNVVARWLGVVVAHWREM
jgi:hypothetical protein